MPAFKDLRAAGVEAHLSTLYSDLLIAPVDGSDVSVRFDATGATEDATAALITRVSMLRRHALAAPFERAFKAIAAGAAPKPGTAGGAAAPLSPSGAAALECVVRLRPSEPIFILPRPDKVIVVFTLEFADPTDRAIARIVCQEFVEAQRTIAATPVSFSDKSPPLELAGKAKDLPPPTSEVLVGYISFSLFPRQVDTEAKRGKAIDLLTQFRSYLDYHIKATKSLLHARMRKRVDGWMQVLNRAVLEDPFEVREKKLMSGKAFTQAGGASAAGGAGVVGGGAAGPRSSFVASAASPSIGTTSPKY